VPVWSPNQLRHNAATRIRAEFGIEAARVILGHASVATSEIYAEADKDKAKQIIGKLG
jgi:site-specific recombinase XerC